MLMQRYVEGIRWFWHLITNPPGLVPVEVFAACPTSVRLRQTQKSLEGLSHLAWGFPSKNWNIVSSSHLLFIISQRIFSL